jgi:peroxiredoxin
MTTTAPELVTSRWFNTPKPLTLASLRGKVVILHAFQMLCPGCVAHGTPQAQKLHKLTQKTGQAVTIGLHSVFEHHAAMTEIALEAFIHEYRLTLPIAVDLPAENGPIPHTMRLYEMNGTPTTIVIDRNGVVRKHLFGQVDDLALGFLIGSLMAEPAEFPPNETSIDEGCDDAGCRIAADPAR